MTPPAAITKNLLMIVAAAIAWRGIRIRGIVSPGGALWRTLVSAIIAGCVTAYAMPALRQDSPAPVPPPASADNSAVEGQPAARPVPEGPRPFAQFQIQTEMGETFDLAHGQYLVAVLSAVCDHCMSTVPSLNDLFLNPELPPLVAVIYAPSEQDLQAFTLQTGPLFPLHSLGNNFIKLSELIGDHPPRLALVRDGALVQHWDPAEEEITFASPEEILAQTGDAAPPETP